ncbi:MAG: AraC family transcriptional regulator [Phycisphaerales bacterium]|nr:MAG: AraC family transcriptional regulator [Phycisphaerales bacterium]
MKQRASTERVKLWRRPELGGVELLRAHYVTQTFNRHTHDGFAVGVIEDGALGFYYHGENVVAPAGMINLVNPGEVHTGHAATECGWTYRMFYFGADLLQDAASEIAGRQAAIPFFRKGVLSDESLADALRALHTGLERGQLSRLEIESRFLAVLTQLIDRHAESKPNLRPVTREPAAVRRARAYIEACYAENISVRKLASVAHLSPFHFIRVFQAQTGMPPHAYLMQTRVRRARALLAQGWRIVDAAYDTGFVDQSHLTKHFKRTLGFTPGQYRNSVQDA